MQVIRWNVGGWPARDCVIRVAETAADLAELDAWLLARADEPLGLDLETNALDPWQHLFRTRCVQVADVHEAWVVPIWSEDGLFTCGDVVSRMIRRHRLWVAHYAESDVRFAQRGLPGDPIRLECDDPHVVDLQAVLAIFDPRTVTTHSKKDRIHPAIPRGSGLKETTDRWLTPALSEAQAALHARFRELAPPRQRTPKLSVAWGFANISTTEEVYRVYAGLDPLCTIRLWHLFRRMLEERGQWARTVAALREQWDVDRETYVGLCADGEYARWLDGELVAVIEGHAPFLASRGVAPSGQGPAVGRAFEALGVDPVRRDPSTGNPSWDKVALAMILEKCGAWLAAPEVAGPDWDGQRAQVEEVAQLAIAVRDVRRAGKYRAAYVKPMLWTVANADGAMHVSMRSIGTVTTRMSTRGTPTAGSLHQLPKHDTRVRACVRARRGHVFVSADFRQGEPFVMAALSGDKVYLADLLAGDVNSTIAAMVYGDAYVAAEGKAAGTPSYLMRQSAKFGFLAWCYGCKARKLALLLGIPVEQGQAVIDRWSTRYPDFAEWQRQTNALAVIELDSGLRVPLWDRCTVNDDGELVLATWPDGGQKPSRLGPNGATQGTQADLLKVARHRARHAGWAWASRFALHDELLWEVPEWMAEAARDALEECMTVTYRGVTVRCEATIEGRTWLPQQRLLDAAELAVVDEDEEVLTG